MHKTEGDEWSLRSVDESEQHVDNIDELKIGWKTMANDKKIELSTDACYQHDARRCLLETDISYCFI